MKHNLALASVLVAVLGGTLLGAMQAGGSAPASDGSKAMERLEPLIGGRWVCEGRWAKGGEFRQEQAFEWGAGRRYIRSRAWTPGAEGAPPTLRSDGVRAYRKGEGRTLFWEFDAFGGVTTGVVGVADERTFFYEYQYPVEGRDRTLRDAWTRLDDEHYEFTSGIFEAGDWQEVYIEGTFTRGQEPPICACCGGPARGEQANGG